MDWNTRRGFFGKIAAMAALVTGGAKVLAQQAPAAAAPGSAPQGAPAAHTPRRPGGSHTHNGIYYFSGTGRMMDIRRTITWWRRMPSKSMSRGRWTR